MATFKKSSGSVVFVLLFYFLGFLYNVDAADESTKEFRLSPNIKPLSYDLYLYPHLYHETFEGKVTILINVISPQNMIQLHQKDLNISSITLKNLNGNDIEILNSFSDNENESLTVKLKKKLDVGRYDLSLTFSGSLGDTKYGFYSRKYKNEDNETRVIATTHFEATHARKAFPCFDEPSFKARFSIKLVYPYYSGYSAISNMNVESITVDQPTPGFTTVTFAKSVLMSTYTVCFIISDLVPTTKEVTKLDGSKLPVSVYTTKAQQDNGKFSLDIAVTMIENFNKLFNLEFPLPKMDIVAIPKLSVDAMENWGLITFKDTVLLYDQKYTSTKNRLWTVQTIAHEFAHMWFGNLVTMKWWNDVWLNEGLASFFQFKATHEAFPSSGYMDLFLQTLHKALNFDQRTDSRPIVSEGSNTTEGISNLFDAIAYHKSPCILRMLEHFVGADTFLIGLSNYLKKFAYANAKTKDLFDSIQAAVGNEININEIMGTWTRQKGYPVINVEKNKLSYSLTQKKFLDQSTDTFDPSESPFGYRWTIPITYTTSKNLTPTLVWFDKDDKNLVITLNESVDWIKFNNRQVGFYRVNYDTDAWISLINALLINHEQLSVHDRAHLIADAFSLAQAGQLNYTTALYLTLYLSKEVDYMPWYVTSEKLDAFKRIFRTQPKTSQKLDNYVKRLVNKIYHKFTWDASDESSSDVRMLFRAAIFKLACSFNHPQCLKDAGSVFKNWIYDEKDVRPHADIRETVYKYGMKHVGNETAWDIMFDRFRSESNAEEREKLINGLASLYPRSVVPLDKFLNIMSDHGHASTDDASTFLEHFTYYDQGADVAWDYARKNWDLLVKRHDFFNLAYGFLYAFFVENHDNKTRMAEVESLFQGSKLLPRFNKFKKMMEKNINKKNNWLQYNLADVDGWFDSIRVSMQ